MSATSEKAPSTKPSLVAGLRHAESSAATSRNVEKGRERVKASGRKVARLTK